MGEVIETIKSIAPASKNDSVFFITLHRSGSSFCERHLLPFLKGLRHIDYASRIYLGKSPKIIFKQKGFVYGPIRLSAYTRSPVYLKLVQPVCEPDFIRNYSVIIFVRDPRTKILSSYKAFGFSHGSSPNDDIRSLQRINRSAVKAQTLDEYVEDAVYWNKKYYEKMIALSSQAKNHAFLRYEDMHHDWSTFMDALETVAEFSEDSENVLRKKLKPPKAQNEAGKIHFTDSSIDKTLSQGVLDFMNVELEPILNFFGYKK